MDGEWGDWIALWGLINMLQLQILVAIVSSLGETRLKVIYPADCQNEAQTTGHEAELVIIIAWNQWLLRIPN